uniref:Uncharacterized protein n=1 Tax=Rhizophora mucronata TaxID=61149 RepID=A0A2P2MZ84_RHIMU
MHTLFKSKNNVSIKTYNNSNKMSQHLLNLSATKTKNRCASINYETDFPEIYKRTLRMGNRPLLFFFPFGFDQSNDTENHHKPDNFGYHFSTRHLVNKTFH